MRDLVKKNLEQFFELPAHFITDDADVYILIILSMYFKDGQAKRDGVRKCEVDAGNLFHSRNDLGMHREGSKLTFYLKKLLKDELPAAIREKAHYEDIIRRDGFSDHLMEGIMCLMEISDKFNCDIKEFPTGVHSVTVNDMLLYVILRNKKHISN